MAFHESSTVPHSPAEVCAALLDEQFHRAVTAKLKGEMVSFTREGQDDGPVTVTMVRTVPAARLPEMVQRFVGDKLRVEQTEQWSAPDQDGARTATLTLTVPTAKVTGEATQAVTKDPSGSELSLQGSVSCRIPLVGGKVAQTAEPMVGKVLGRQARELTAWLAR